MGSEEARVLVATSGRKPKSDRRVEVRLLAYRGGRVETVVDVYGGLRLLSRTIGFEGTGRMEAMFAGRLFNEIVDRLKEDGFRGLRRIDFTPDKLGDAFSYVSLTGNQPRFDEAYDLDLTDGEEAEFITAGDAKFSGTST